MSTPTNTTSQKYEATSIIALRLMLLIGTRHWPISLIQIKAHVLFAGKWVNEAGKPAI